jgi:hypothetical protein
MTKAKGSRLHRISARQGRLKAKVYDKTGKVYAAWSMKVFIRRGQKKPRQKSEGFENDSNSRGKAENQVWHVSCILCFHGKKYSAHMEFASRQLAKRTRR